MAPEIPFISQICQNMLLEYTKIDFIANLK